MYNLELSEVSKMRLFLSCDLISIYPYQSWFYTSNDKWRKVAKLDCPSIFWESLGLFNFSKIIKKLVFSLKFFNYGFLQTSHCKY